MDATDVSLSSHTQQRFDTETENELSSDQIRREFATELYVILVIDRSKLLMQCLLNSWLTWDLL